MNDEEVEIIKSKIEETDNEMASLIDAMDRLRAEMHRILNEPVNYSDNESNLPPELLYQSHQKTKFDIVDAVITPDYQRFLNAYKAASEQRQTLENDLRVAIKSNSENKKREQVDYQEKQLAHEKELAIIRLREKEIELEIARLNAQSGENLSDGIDALIGDLKGSKEDG